MDSCQIIVESGYYCGTNQIDPKGDPVQGASPERKGAELCIYEGCTVYASGGHEGQPGLDIEIAYDSPGVTQRWQELKRQIQGFAGLVLANGIDNSEGACTERMCTEEFSSSESFQINTDIGPEGSEEPAELYIDGDARAILVLPERGSGKPGSDTVAFFSDPIGPELARGWEELKGQILSFASFLAAMNDQREVAPA